MNSYRIAGLALAGALALGTLSVGTGTAQAACVTKGAMAQSGTAESAKWYALETMVQSVSWGLWPSYVANGSVPGYKITSQTYKCANDAGGVTCHGRATFCSTK